METASALSMCCNQIATIVLNFSNSIWLMYHLSSEDECGMIIFDSKQQNQLTNLLILYTKLD